MLRKGQLVGNSWLVHGVEVVAADGAGAAPSVSMILHQGGQVMVVVLREEK